tara:strand:- start:20364 stop:20843 length:480 start_codon:yes stop_codon:yes gene_type:complete
MKNNLIKLRSIYLISILVILLDQLTKSLATIFLNHGKPSDLMPGLIQLNLVKNTGAAFSLFSKSTSFLSLVSLIVTFIIIIWLWKSAPITLLKGIGAAFLLAGTVGNGIDRWRLGYVTDFIQLIPINFPIFNLADISINIALFFLFLDAANNRNRSGFT